MERGSALVLSILLVAFVSTLAATFFLLSSNSIRTSSALFEGLRASAGAEAALVSTLPSVTLSPSPFQIPTPTGLISGRNLSGPFFELRSENLSASGSAMRVSLLRLFQSPERRLPHWAQIINSDPANTLCDQWAVDGTSLMLNCLHLTKDLGNGGLIWGDYQTEADIRLEDRNSTFIRIAVLGNLKLDHALLINRSHDFRLEILADSDVAIKELRIKDSSNIEVLLHSSYGKVNLLTAPAPGALCDLGTPAELRLQIEANHSIRVGGSESSESSVGCSLSRNSEIWSAQKIVGGHVFVN